ncbi:MAG: lipid-A-disaccharide synthase [Chitinophagaceae bacterium]
MKYYIIAGEASGDLHGSNLISAICRKDDAADIRCWGGDKMEQAGATLVKHYRDLAFMGFVEVVKHLGTILKNLRSCKQDVLRFRPDVLVLIDYPGFNLRIARWAHTQGIKVVYYISPQVWAWKENRVKMMRKCIDHMLVILPFEKQYYANKWQWDVEYVGHPLIEAIQNDTKKHNDISLSNKPIVALLPGSRRQEIMTKLPIMLEASKVFPDYSFVVAAAPGVDAALYESLIGGAKHVRVVRGNTYALLQQSSAALVTSGTATLETALLHVPQVVCYKGNPISYHIARRVIRVPFISLVNLILNKEAVKELIQNDLNPNQLIKSLKEILPGGEKRENILADYEELKAMLQEEVPASEKAASSVIAWARR